MSLPQGTLTLGSLTLQSRFVLAPLESVSDAAFRSLCHAQGAALTFTEMIRARGIVRNNKATLDLIDSVHPSVPTGIQMLVTSADELKEALERLETLANTTHPHFKNLCAIDLNFGCPSPEVIRIGAGPALLKRRGKMKELFATLRAWKSSTALPVGAISAKIRLGLHRTEQDQKVYLPIVDLANEHLDFLTVHARHARQHSKDEPSWSALAEAKARSRIPLLGNGNVFTLADATRVFEATGVNAFLIARGAIRSPWCFRDLRGSGALEPTPEELESARAEYVRTAEALNSKEKFRVWHAEGFARIAARIAGTARSGPELPENEHMA